jgi:hypothetical protein
MRSAPMNAVKERKACSLARREAGAESRMVDDIGARGEPWPVPLRTCLEASSLPRGAQTNLRSQSKLGNHRTPSPRRSGKPRSARLG